jgi:sirohydrochlorin ferrochelatase
MRKLTSSVKGGPCSTHKVVVLEAFLLEGLLIDHITKAEENLL